MLVKVFSKISNKSDINWLGIEVKSDNCNFMARAQLNEGYNNKK